MESAASASVSLRTGADGRFELRDLRPGAYSILVRKLGYEPVRVPIVLLPTDTLSQDISLSVANPYEAEELEKQLQFRLALAKARSRPRRWTCENRAAIVAEYANDWLWLVEVARRREVEGSADEEGIPSDSAHFLRDFRPITKADCARIARNLDESYGLIDDHIVAFRIGRVHLLPLLAVIADENGVVKSVYVH